MQRKRKMYNKCTNNIELKTAGTYTKSKQAKMNEYTRNAEIGL